MAHTPVVAAAGLLDALTRRDFDQLGRCLADDVRFRAVLPSRTLDETGPAATVAWLAKWFADTDLFDVVDAAIGQLGPRLYVRWRLRVRATGAESVRLIEQHAFLTVSDVDLIDRLDLLCSGFHPETPL